MDPLTAGVTFSAGAGGAGGAGAAMANPIAAAVLAAALGTAYGVSPKFRKKSNEMMHKGWEGISNPFQHFGDGSEKDTLGQRSMLAGIMGGGGQPGGHLPGGIGMLRDTSPRQEPGFDINNLLRSLGQGVKQNQNQRQQRDQQQQAIGGMMPYGRGGTYPIDPGYIPVPRARPMIEDPFGYSQQADRRAWA